MSEIKRLLTDGEIDYILSGVVVPKKLTTQLKKSIEEITKRDITFQLKKCLVYPSIIEELKSQITREYNNTLVSPGENVGIITAQSIGERQTQLTLNSFHQAGLTVKTVVTGVPRFTELINTSKDPKGVISTIPLKVPQKTIKDVRDYIGDCLKEITLHQLSSDINVVTYSDVGPDSWWLGKPFLPEEFEFLDTTKILRYTLDKNLLYVNRVSLHKIKSSIEMKYNDMVVCPSSLEVGIVDVFIKNPESINLNNVDRVQYITGENIDTIFLEEVVERVLKSFVVSGISGIKDYIIRRDSETSEWIIDTEGCNFRELVGSDLFDTIKIVSNNMWDIYEVLGIEATREFLIDEFTKVVSSDGSYINPRHVSVLVDTMTFKGDITSISRYSVRNKTSPMARASFEESVDNFLKSGVFCEKEKLDSISSNIMVGKTMSSGTGLCDVLMDSKLLNMDEISRMGQ